MSGRWVLGRISPVTAVVSCTAEWCAVGLLRRSKKLFSANITGRMHTRGFCGRILQVFFGVLLAVVPCCGGEQPTGKNILVLFGANRPDNREMLDSLEREIRPRVPSPITFHEAYLTTNYDLKRYSAYTDSQAQALRHTYGGIGLDLIIAVYSPAVEFVIQYRDKMFPDVPMMFAGIGVKAGQEWKDWPGVPGATFAVGLRETIDLALKLHPDTKRVAVVAGPDWFWIGEIHAELLRRNVEAVDIISKEASREMVEKVAALPPHTVALLHTTITPARSEFGGRELIQGVSQIMPTYSAWKYICLGFGCVGGAYADEHENAAATAEIAARILAGERPENIPVAYNGELRTTVDWRALQRWHVPDLAVPAGTLVLNRESSLWERGRDYFLAGIAVIVVQTLLITALFWQRARKRRAEAELRTSEEKFSKSFRESPLAVIMTRLNDFQLVEVNEVFQEQTGWSRDEVIGRNLLDIDLWVDRNQTGEFREKLRSTGSVRDWEVQIRKKDGETRTLVVSAEVIDVNDEVCALSVATDITERKQAEQALSSVSRRLIEAHEEERVRIARELHDDINQRLAFLSVSLSNLKQGVPASDASTKQGVEQVRQELSELGNDVQALSHRLHSSKLEYLGLAVAARSFCKEFCERHNVEILFHDDNIPRNLAPEISLCLFRVLQEALRNALKYSGTRRFEVTLEGTSSEIHLSVRDTGVGFDPEAAIHQQGLGLISMRERLKLVDGQLSIDAKPQGGTTVHARVPLTPRFESQHNKSL